MQLLGVCDIRLVELIAKAINKLGVKRGMVVFGQEKLDEISICVPTLICEFDGNSFMSYEITPEQFGIERCTGVDLIGVPLRKTPKLQQIFLVVKRNIGVMLFF